MPEPRKQWKKQSSAGGLVLRGEGDDAFILMIRPRREDAKTIWGFPKGMATDHADGSLEATALREVREEGGVQASILKYLGEIHYFFSFREENISKTVHYFLMEYLDGDTKDHDEEVEEAVWVPLAEAGSRLSYKNDREMLGKALRGLNV